MLAPLKGKILVVDDNETVRAVVAAMLEARGHEVTAVSNGQEALTVVRLGWPDVVLSDLVMPVMDGFELVSRLKADQRSAAVPVIVMTSMGDRSARIRALEAGAEDFVVKPVDETELLTRVGNYLRLKDFHSQLEDANRILEREVRHRTDELLGSNLETIFVLCRAMEFKDMNSGSHLKRISQYCCLLAERVGLEAEFIDCITHAAPMHDIGKVGVPDSILLKPGPLDEAEWEIMRQHCQMGADLLRDGHSPYLRMGAEIALCHHENWDGTGYPTGLRGKDIPLSARIMAVCDRYDALRAARPYKRAYDHAETLNVLLKGDGRSMPEQLDPELLMIFQRNSLEFDEVFRLNQF